MTVCCPNCGRRVAVWDRTGWMVTHNESDAPGAAQCPASGMSVERAQHELDRELERLKRGKP